MYQRTACCAATQCAFAIIGRASSTTLLRIVTPRNVSRSLAAAPVSFAVVSRRQAKTGREELIGKTALVKVALNPSGTVFFKGERWEAISEEGQIKPGENVVITKVDGLTLYVTRKQQDSK